MPLTIYKVRDPVKVTRPSDQWARLFNGQVGLIDNIATDGLYPIAVKIGDILAYFQPDELDLVS